VGSLTFNSCNQQMFSVATCARHLFQRFRDAAASTVARPEAVLHAKAAAAATAIYYCQHHKLCCDHVLLREHRLLSCTCTLTPLCPLLLLVL
jgi:hypothetical protein